MEPPLKFEMLTILNIFEGNQSYVKMKTEEGLPLCKIILKKPLKI
jgi:hypothetical protein